MNCLSLPLTSHPARQHGQGSVEFLLAAVPLLLMGLGSIEAIHWHFTRQAMSLALAQAARAAITNHADPGVIDDAFFHALLPVHAAPTHEAARERVLRNMERREAATGLPAWRIQIRSPSEASFRDFASRDPDLPRHGGRKVIDNDYLEKQHELRLAQGWPQGRGPASGQTALEANVLVLHLTWLHEPLLPGVGQLFRQLAPPDAGYGSLAMARGGFLPIRREVAFLMQSHAIAWPMPPHGRVVRAGNDHETAKWGNTGTPGPEGSIAGRPDVGAPGSIPAYDRPCTGLWCLESAVRESVADEAAGTAPGTGNRGYVPGNRGGEPGDYRDAGALPAADEPPGTGGADDCPGCCD